MNLDDCTTPQREVVTTRDAPLMVAAGAGSGKTFTLTRRIAAALLPDKTGRSYLSSIKEVCAITFTNRAAAELRDRIKTLLISEGMVDQALLVDDAWISTIHAMAGRILRENALELGLDPGFEMLSETEVEELQHEAANRVISEAARGEDELLQRALAEETKPPFDKGGIAERAMRIVHRCEATPDGFDAIVIAEPTYTPSKLLRELCDLAYTFRDVARAWEKPTKTDLAALDEIERALEDAQAYLEEPGVNQAGFDDEDFDIERFCGIFYSFPPTSNKFHAAKDDADFFATYRSAYARLSEELETGVTRRKTLATVRFAEAVHNRFCEIKGPARLDNTDLLTQCYQALSDHPEMAAHYRNRFKFIMVDEFQDTDRLQVALISLIAQPNLANVCTVGDAQQSIYRFRGADIDAFFAYRDRLLSINPAAHTVALPDNFRSHADILALVDTIFSQPQVFGGDFLHLEPRAALNAEHDPLFDTYPRLAVDAVHYSTSRDSVSADEARAYAAAHIAERFARLRAAGVQASEMVLLLGAMTHVNVYADALRAAGLESIVAGGSVFSQSEEAQLVKNLLCYAVNADDEPALFLVLTSMLFALPDDVLLALTSRRDDAGNICPRSLSDGFADEHGGEGLGLSPRSETALNCARTALAHFRYTACSGQASKALRALFVETGLLDRLETTGAIGLAQAGNLAKALSLVEKFEQETPGISGLAHAYGDHLACEKLTPGALATLDSDFVRIMTVHAAKGLEFAHVAVAEMKPGSESRDSFYAENVDDITYVATGLPTTATGGAVIDKLRKFDRVDDDFSETGTHMSQKNCAELSAHVGRQELAESRRLLYVAMTRASRSLMLSMCVKTKPETACDREGIYRDVYTALQWDISANASQEMISCGASSPVQVTFRYLRKADDDTIAVEDDAVAAKDPEIAEKEDDVVAQTNDENTPVAPQKSETEEGSAEADDLHNRFIVACRPPVEPVTLTPSEGAYADVFSYTSLAGAEEDTSTDARDRMIVADDDDETLLRTPADTATDLGTAFHLLSQRTVLRRNAYLSSCVRDASEDTYGSKMLSLFAPDREEIAQMAWAQALSQTQLTRLFAACDRWYASNLAQSISAFDDLHAEVPFMIALSTYSDKVHEKFYLEGAIDLLAIEGDSATVVDFKTGGFAGESPDQLHNKHLFQAQCYALALLFGDINEVQAHFVRVEHTSSADSDEPQIVDYLFTRDDFDELYGVVCAAWQRAQETSGQIRDLQLSNTQDGAEETV